MKELSNVWGDLTDISKANILELIGGKRNSNVTAALLENFSVADQALAASMNSAGSALAENEKYLDSIAGKVAEFKASTQEFSTELVNSETVKNIVEAGTGLVEMATAMQRVGVFIPIVVMGFQVILTALNNIKLAKSFDDLIVDLQTGKTNLEQFTAKVRLLNAEEQKLLITRLGIQQANYAEETDEYELLQDSINAVNGAINHQNNIVNKTKGSFAGMFQTSDDFWASIKNGFKTNPFAFIASGATAAISAISSVKQRIDQSRQSAIDAAHEIQEAFEETVTSYETNTDALAAMTARYKELERGVFDDGSNDSLSPKDYEEYLNLVEQVHSIINSMPREYQLRIDTSSVDGYIGLLEDAIDLQNTLLYDQKVSRAESVAKEYKGIKTEYQNIQRELTKAGGEIDDFYADINALIASNNGEQYKITEALNNYLGSATASIGSDNLEFTRDSTSLDKMRHIVENRQEFLDTILKSSEDLSSSDLVEIESSIADMGDTFADLNSAAADAADAIMNKLEVDGETSDRFAELPQGVQTYFESYITGLYDVSDTTSEYLDKSENAMDEILAVMSDDVLGGQYDALMELFGQLQRGEISYGLFDHETSKFLQALTDRYGEGSVQVKVFTDYLLSLGAGYSSVGDTIASTTDNVIKSSAAWTKYAEGFKVVQENLDTLSDALTNLNDGTLELADVVDLVTQFPELAEYVDLTAENFGDLRSGLNKLLRESPDELITQLKEMRDVASDPSVIEALDGMIYSMENMPVENVQSLAKEWGLVADAITASNVAQTELEKSLSQDDYDAGFNDRVEAYEGFTELIDRGVRGGLHFDAYAEYFGLAGESFEEIESWLAKNAKYLDFNDEGDVSTDGIQEFLKTVEGMDLSEIGAYASWDGSNWTFEYDVNNLDKFAEALGWSEEMLTDFINAYRIYCEDWEEYTPQELDTMLQNEGLINDGNVASLEELMSYTGKTEEEVRALIDSINELRAQNEQEPVTISVDFSGEDSIDTVVAKFRDAGIELRKHVEFGADGSPITSYIIDQSAIDQMYEYYGSTEKVVEQLEILKGMEGIEIEAGLKINNEFEVDTITPDVKENYTEVTVTMNVEGGDEVVETVRVYGEEARAVLEEAGIADGATTSVQNLKTALSELPPETPIEVVDSSEQARNHLVSISGWLDKISQNKYQDIYVTYHTSVEKNATGTKHAKAGMSLLGDEYSATGSPKPELVVSPSTGTAYVAGTSGPTLGYLNDGDIVYTYSETKKILSGGGKTKPFQAFGGGTSGSGLGYTPKSTNRQLWSGASSSSYSSSSTSSSKSSSSAFEDLYNYHQHLLAMEQESMEEYLEWLDEAYQKAYKKGEIELEDFYKYQEEVFEGLRDLFADWLDDQEHYISMIEDNSKVSKEIISIYKDMISAIDKEILAAYAAGLDTNDDYVQELLDRRQDCADSIVEIEEETNEDAKDTVEELIDFRVDMLKHELEEEKDALNERLDALKEFYDKQKQMLQDSYDEEQYLEEQAEKRKTISDIETELASLEHDDSAWAQKRKLELQEELAEANKDLEKFEKDKALELAQASLDKQYEIQEAEIEAEEKLIDDKLNNEKALRDQALEDIRNGSVELYEEMMAYNDLYGSGISEDIVEMWEEAYRALAEYKALYDEDYKGIRLDDVTGYEERTAASEAASAPPSPPESTEPTTESSSESSSGNYPYGKASETTGNIGKGSEGVGVQAIQYALNKLGYGNYGTEDHDGIFGSGTKIAVLAFQRDNGMKGDGIVGVKTRAAFASHGYSLGTTYAIPGLSRVDELGPEYLFTAANGKKYRMFSGGEKMLDAAATNFLYDFANTRGSIIGAAAADALATLQKANYTRSGVGEIRMGDIIIQGNANEKTVSEIRRAQREGVDYLLKEFSRLSR